MSGLKTAAGMAALAGLLVSLGGCGEVTRAVQDWTKTDAYRFLGPEKVVRPPEGTPINPILASAGPVDRTQELVPNATMPREGDWSYSDEEYRLGPTDIVDISVLDLYQEGQETLLRREVSNAGLIDLPLLTERIVAEGLTKEELREAIRDAYSPEILRDPTVSVTIAARRQNTFSILGAVNRPGTYNILRRDMRLLEGLALAGGVSQTNIKYIYVIRPKPAPRIRKTPLPRRPSARPVTLPGLPEEAPPEPKTRPAGPATTAPKAPAPPTAPAAKPATRAAEALDELEKLLKGTGAGTAPAPTPGVLLAAATDAPATAPETAPAVDADLKKAARTPKWIYSGGRWIRAPGGEKAPATQPTAPAGAKPQAPSGDPTDPFGWKKINKSDMARIIAIDLEQLRAGDPRMNIILRDNDIVQVPPLEVGEFYVMGEVLRPGVYSLTGRQITVKMALAAAGNMNALAWPEHSVLIRRIGGRQEQIIPLNVEAIFRGDDPDLFLKPNDVIAIGTDPRSTFMAVVRNAFRMTYGFGFIYDRNFDDPRNFTPTSRRFTRW